VVRLGRVVVGSWVLVGATVVVDAAPVVVVVPGWVSSRTQARSNKASGMSRRINRVRERTHRGMRIQPLRAARSARIDSTMPSRRLAGAVAVPASTARAAASASIGSNLRAGGECAGPAGRPPRR
jgi:hypothetical protein